MATVELPSGEEVEGGCEETDPGGTANGMKQKRIRRRAGVHHGSEKAQKERRAENNVCAGRINDGGNDFGM